MDIDFECQSDPEKPFRYLLEWWRQYSHERIWPSPLHKTDVTAVEVRPTSTICLRPILQYGETIRHSTNVKYSRHCTPNSALTFF